MSIVLKLLKKVKKTLLISRKRIKTLSRSTHDSELRQSLINRMLGGYEERTKIQKHAINAALNEDWTSANKYYKELNSITSSHKDDKDLELSNEALANISIIKIINDLSTYKNNIQKYQKAILKSPPKIAIVTANTGNYDSVKPPIKINPKFDYIIYSDVPLPNYGIYKIKPIPYYDSDPTRRARYIKTNLNKFTLQYDYAVWIDSNIIMVEDVESLITPLIKNKSLIGALPHPIRTNVLEEANACIRAEKDDPTAIKKQIKYYTKEITKNLDLIESNFMFYKIKEAKLNNFFSTWWQQINNFSKRDQLSFGYSIKKNRLSWSKIYKNYNVRNHPYFAIIRHSQHLPALDYLQNQLNQGKKDIVFTESTYSIPKKHFKETSKIDIIYCVHNALDDVIECLDSVSKTRTKNTHLIIVDDGSDKQTSDYLDYFKTVNKWVSLERNKTASGYTKAVNKGIRRSSAPFVILLNSDTIVTTNWIQKMVEVMINTPNCGIVGPLSSAASHQSIPNIEGKDGQTAVNDLADKLGPNDINNHVEKWSLNREYYPHVPLIHGFCMLINRSVFDKIGIMDEKKFPRGYGEENDFCFRASDAGFSLVVATNTYIYHKKSKSYSNNEARRKLMDEGANMLRSTYGIQRIQRSVISMVDNPDLKYYRQKTKKLYHKP